MTVEDLAEKEAVLAAGNAGVFTIPHFDGYAAVLVQLDAVSEAGPPSAAGRRLAGLAPQALADGVPRRGG